MMVWENHMGILINYLWKAIFLSLLSQLGSPLIAIVRPIGEIFYN